MLKLFLLISILIYSIADFQKSLLIFQQNRYELTRLTSWMKEQNIDRENIIVFFLQNSFWVVLFVLSLFFKNILWICGVLAVFLGILKFLKEKKKKYIKPLVYTARVKRQITCLLILVILLGIILLCLNDSFIVIYYIGSSILSYLLLYPMFYLCEPIEKAVRNYYLDDAKNRINSNLGLIKVGITGSYGKTSTKNIIQNIISDQYYSLMTPSSFNTPMGITRTIREYLKPLHEVFICEMGADKVGDIDELTNFVKPKYGIVTSIGPQHLATFGSLENIIKEKMLMIENLPSDGVGILNYDNSYIRDYKISNSCKVITCGIENDNVDYQAVSIIYKQDGSVFKVKHQNQLYDFETKLLGKHSILNILMGIALASELGVSMNDLQKSVLKVEKIEHRLEPKMINGYHFIDDAFNANPEGSKEALEVLGKMNKNRWIVTPGMIDLGEIQDEVNKNFGKQMKDRADFVVLVGKKQTASIFQGLIEVGFNEENLFVVDKVQEAFGIVYQNATLKDTILLENDLPDAFNV